jgi:hypothetical protein
MPLSPSDFPEDVQVAFFMFSLLSDKWDGASGMYMGKDWSSCEYMLNLWEVEDQTQMVYLMKMYEGIILEHRAVQTQKQAEADERKRGRESGVHHTHSVKG